MSFEARCKQLRWAKLYTRREYLSLIESVENSFRYKSAKFDDIFDYTKLQSTKVGMLTHINTLSLQESDH